MTTLPDVEDLVDGGTTEAQFQAAMEEFYNYTAQLVVGSEMEALDILDGVVTPSKTFIVIDTENDTASDNLDRIDPTDLGVKTLYLKITSSSRAVVLRHLQGGSGQLYLSTGANLTMDNLNMVIVFHYNPASDRWEEMWRNFGVFAPSGSSQSAARAALGLGTASQVNTGTASGAVPLNSDLGPLAYLSSLTNASQVGNGIITNDKLFGGITLAKLANTTPNSVFTVSSSGVPQLVTATSSGTFVGFNGSGIGFIAAGGGGGIGSVGQGDLRTSTGQLGFPNGGPVMSNFVLPGGAYGFYPQIALGGGLSCQGQAKIMDTQNQNGGVWTSYIWLHAMNAVSAVIAQQRYVTASPPYIMPEAGEAAGFIYAVMEGHDIKQIYIADTPPWVYNGPTNCDPEVFDSITKKKYRRKERDLVSKIRANGGKPTGECQLNFPAKMEHLEKYERRLARNLLQARAQLGRESFGIVRSQIEHNIRREITNEILTEDYVEITQEMEMADMSVINHPFTLKPGQTVVLLGLYSDVVRELINAQNNGENIMQAFIDGYFTADNEIKVGVSPKGVKLVNLKVK